MGRILTTSKNYEAERSGADIDMSAEAVTNRLKRVSQLRRLCVALGKAELEADAPEEKAETDTLKSEDSDR